MHPYTFLFTNLKSLSCLPPASPLTHVGTRLIQSTPSKNYLKWHETWQLDSSTVDGLEDNKLV